MFRELILQSLSVYYADGCIDRLTDRYINIEPIEKPSITFPLMPTYDVDLLSYDTVVFEFRYRSLGWFMSYLWPSLFPDISSS